MAHMDVTISNDYMTYTTEGSHTTYVPERHGKWIKKEEGQYSWYECSYCGKEPLCNRFGVAVLSDYCPHCGAIMEK